MLQIRELPALVQRPQSIAAVSSVPQPGLIQSPIQPTPCMALVPASSSQQPYRTLIMLANNTNTDSPPKKQSSPQKGSRTQGITSSPAGVDAQTASDATSQRTGIVASTGLAPTDYQSDRRHASALVSQVGG